MSTTPPTSPISTRPLSDATPWWRALVVPTPVDWVMQVYLALLLVGLGAAPRTPQRDLLVLVLLACGALHAGAIVVAHAKGTPSGWRRAVMRLAPVGAVAVPYFNLREIIPLLNPRLFDAELWRLDLMLFGAAPAAAAEPLLSYVAVEWLSLAYVSYWVVGMAFVLAHLASTDDTLGGRFLTPLVLSLCAGGALYALVPAFGPWVAQPDSFAAPLTGGPIYDFMHRVAGAGAQRDVFPSLHTAHMVIFAVYCWRGNPRWRRFAWAVSFAAVNVIAATILLRWHYVVDVIAGIAFAALVVHFGWKLNRWYEDKRAEVGLSITWW